MNRRAASRALFGVAVVLLAVTTARVSSQVPVFTTAFPAEEFAAHRAALFDERSATASPSSRVRRRPASYLPFRQSNHFFYLTGVEVPRAIVLLDGKTKTAMLFLPPRNEQMERMEGPVLVPGADAVRLTGIADVRASEAFRAAFGRGRRGGRVVYTPARGESVAAVTPDSAMRSAAGVRRRPVGWTALARGGVRGEADRCNARRRHQRASIPILDALRVIKTPRRDRSHPGGDADCRRAG